MQPLLRARPQQIAAGFVAVTMTCVGFLPLFGGPGYEQSLASGLVVPATAAIATACELSTGPPFEPIAAVGRGVESGLVLAGVAFATALLQSIRVGMCDFLGGLVSFALTALVGSVLGGVWGALVAEVARGRKRRRVVAVVLGFGLPLASALVSVVRFYTSPMIFAFDPFVGYFSGTLYDTVIDAGTALLTYRLGSLASLGFVVLLASVLTRDEAGRLRLGPIRGPRSVPARARFALALVCLVASVAVTVSGPALGHWETADTIAEDLGGARSGVRCDAVFPQSLLPDEAALIVKDCDEQLAAVEKTLGARGPARVRAFFFGSAAEKKRLMGAADTLIAKPWREEVYVQLSSYPHPVLGHELAHVVAGSFGRGPFRIAGALDGLWPDPGRIEGVAVAASPDDEELTDAQWAHAMLDLGTLPPIKSLFSLGFLNVAASKSYTLAGAFVRFVMDRYGSGVVRAWYGGGSIEALTGRSWSELDADFRAEVKKTPLSGEAQSFAKARFERAAVFGRVCPHVVDALKRKGDVCRDAHEVARATEAYRGALARDPHDWGASYGLGVVNLRYGDSRAGEKTLRAMLDAEETPRTWRDRVKDALADHALAEGDDVAAKAVYEELASKSLEEDFARTCEVKARAVGDPLARAAIVAMLVGTPHRPGDIVVGAEQAGEWDAKSDAPLAEYIVGRNLAGREWYSLAASHLDGAVEGGATLTPRIARESIRQRAIVACALGDAATIPQLKELVTASDGPFATSTGRRQAVLRFLDRCSTTGSPRAKAASP